MFGRDEREGAPAELLERVYGLVVRGLADIRSFVRLLRLMGAGVDEGGGPRYLCNAPECLMGEDVGRLSAAVTLIEGTTGGDDPWDAVGTSTMSREQAVGFFRWPAGEEDAVIDEGLTSLTS